jgi:hypothetical protein
MTLFITVKQARSQTKFSGGAKQIFGGALYINVLNINAIYEYINELQNKLTMKHILF